MQQKPARHHSHAVVKCLCSRGFILNSNADLLWICRRAPLLFDQDKISRLNLRKVFSTPENGALIEHPQSARLQGIDRSPPGSIKSSATGSPLGSGGASALGTPT